LKTSKIRKWGPWLALVLVFSIATSLLSWWQFSRREEAVNKIDLVLENYDSAPVPLSELIWEIDENGNAKSEWQSVLVTGEYVSEYTTLVRNRPLSGQPGFLQLVPLRLQNGEILIVERGWLAGSSDITTPQSNPLPDSGLKELVVRLRAPEMDLGKAEVAGQLASINLDLLVERFSGIGRVIPDYYGRLVSETPGSNEYPIALPRPSLNEGNHLSYAFQWIIFGLMAFIAFLWAYRNDKRLQLESQGLLTPKVRKRTLADQDNEIEDASQ